MPIWTVTHPFAVFGYHVTGSDGRLFLYGIVVGAVAIAGLSLVLAAAPRDAATRPAAGSGSPAARPPR
jgi:hypothetical protein